MSGDRRPETNLRRTDRGSRKEAESAVPVRVQTFRCKMERRGARRLRQLAIHVLHGGYCRPQGNPYRKNGRSCFPPNNGTRSPARTGKMRSPASTAPRSICLLLPGTAVRRNIFWRSTKGPGAFLDRRDVRDGRRVLRKQHSGFFEQTFDLRAMERRQNAGPDAC